jgi:hypothetical protein
MEEELKTNDKNSLPLWQRGTKGDLTRITDTDEEVFE